MGSAGGNKEICVVSRGMDQNMLFSLALGLAAPWKVVRSGLEDGGAESKFLYVDIEVEAGAQMPCPVCGTALPAV